ncbi:hypothetical protein [Nocardia sp. NPDC058666]|uniref:hypothetical protein n=1 Tax=unclassified Nocardia TaxID=2637762 RepID=UPI0036499ED1
MHHPAGLSGRILTETPAASTSPHSRPSGDESDPAPILRQELVAAAVRGLDSVPALLTELDTTLSRSDSFGARYGVRIRAGANENSLPFNVLASDATRDLCDILNQCASAVETASADLAPRGPAAQAIYIRGRLLAVPDCPEIPTEMLTLAVEAILAATAAIDSPGDQRRVGTCPCGEPLAIDIRTSTVICARCGRSRPYDNGRSTLATTVAEVVASIPEIVELLPRFVGATVKPATLRQWVARGKLEPISAPSPGPARYRLRDVLTLLGV